MTAEEFKNLRILNNLTQEEVGKIMNVKREIVSYFENGKRNISTVAINNFLNFLGLNNENYKQNKIKLECSYNKKYKKNFKNAIWLNNFVNNLSYIKTLNQGVRKI